MRCVRRARTRAKRRTAHTASPNAVIEASRKCSSVLWRQYFAFPCRSAPRLGVADDAQDVGVLAPQPALDGIHQVVHRADRERRIDPAVKIDDLAGRGFADADV